MRCVPPTAVVVLALAAAAHGGVQTTQCLLPSIPLEKFGESFEFDCTAPPAGTILRTFTDLAYFNDPGQDAAEIMFTIVSPAAGSPTWVLTGADLGWSGFGIFFAEVESDLLDGSFDLGDPPDVAYFHITLEMVPGGTMQGQFITSTFNVDIDAPAPCPWDLDGDGDVATADFLTLLGMWGTDPGGPPDFDSNGDVGTSDFLALLGNWGPCPE